MFEAYILPVLIFAVMGILAGVLLTAASKIFEVKSDLRTDEVNEALPQVNCGACGYSGCSDYAKAIVEKGEKTNLCKPGGAASAEKISSIMGVSADEAEKAIAVVRCSADCTSKQKSFEFEGERTCVNAKRFYGGMWGCKYGCFGQGDCARVCPSDAIVVKDGLARVDKSKCIGCGMCEKVCPNDIIEIRKAVPTADVLCRSKDMGKAVKAVCSKGCIGCKICEKQCEFDAIHVTDNLASVDHEKCTACGKCAAKCPVKVITISKV
ncbi:MAG: RnfABCDGE type electron transport complex subunit B [Oscillospiraceae bacterium]|nr:RnfABCDGE type electron transport complex subunit B [Oscillospiraceae bacterium]